MKPQTQTTRDIIAASFQAFLDNGRTVKKIGWMTTENKSGSPVCSNTNKIEQYVQNGYKGVSEESYKLADECLEKIRENYNWAIMREDYISDFVRKISILVDSDEIVISRNRGLISFIPQYYNNLLVEEETSDRLSQCDNSSFPRVGMQDIMVEILLKRYSKNYGNYFIKGITSNNESVSFFLKENPESNIIKIRAKFRNLEEDGVIRLTRISLKEVVKV